MREEVLMLDSGIVAGTKGLIVKLVNKFINWSRKWSLWPLPFGTACCAIEFMAVVASHYDISRWGAEFIRFSPRQADVLMVMGTITRKMVPVLVRIYEQMAEPKWVIAVGSCACTGNGIFQSYSVLPGIDEVIPVDVYVAGCPPRPEAILDGLQYLQKVLDKQAERDKPVIFT